MEQHIKTIGDESYLVIEMDGIRALKAQAKLIKILGTGVISLIGKDTTTLDSNTISNVVSSLMSNFDDNLVVEFVLSLFEKGVWTEKDGKPHTKVDFSTHFTGKINMMWKVVMFILEVNFSMGELFPSPSLTTGEEKATVES